MPLLEVSGLVKEFTRGKGLFRKGTIVTAVDNVSFSVDEGKRSGWSASQGAARRPPGGAFFAWSNRRPAR
jgi:ABC-type antimicrobial peptide transport system ATPase subunit